MPRKFAEAFVGEIVLAIVLLASVSPALGATYGYVGDTGYRIYTGVSASTSCPSPAAKTAGVWYVNLEEDTDSIEASCYRFVPRWDTTPIPDAATIDSVEIKFTLPNGGNKRNCDYRPIQFDPNVSSFDILWNDAGNGTAYVSNNTNCTLGGTPKLVLGTNANTDLENSLPQDWFAVGIHYNNETRDNLRHWAGADPGVATDLQVNFTMPAPVPIYNLAYEFDELGQYNISFAPTGEDDYWTVGYYLLKNGTPEPFSITQKPILHLRFDNTSTQNVTNYGSGLSNTTTTGYLDYRASPLGYGAYFDSGDYLDVGKESDYDFERTDKFSFAFWHKDGNWSGNRAIIEKAVAAGGTGYWVAFENNGNFDVSLRNTTNSNELYEYLALSPYLDDRWHHFAVTYDGSSNSTGLKIYVDGTEKNTTIWKDNLNASIMTDQTFRVGGDHAAGVCACTLDDVRIYNFNLSASQVLDIYNSTYRSKWNYPPESSLHGAGSRLYAHWRLDNSLRDSANDFDVFMVQGSELYTNATVGRALQMYGQQNGELYQANVSATRSDFAFLHNTTAKWEMSFWVYPQVPGTNEGVIFSTADQTAGNTKGILVYLQGQELTFLVGNGTDWSVNTNPCPLDSFINYQWYFVTLGYDYSLASNNVYCTVNNGSYSNASKSAIPAQDGDSANTPMLGHRGAPSLSAGSYLRLDDFRIFSNYTLNATERSNLYASRAPELASISLFDKNISSPYSYNYTAFSVNMMGTSALGNQLLTAPSPNSIIVTDVTVTNLTTGIMLNATVPPAAYGTIHGYYITRFNETEQFYREEPFDLPPPLLHYKFDGKETGRINYGTANVMPLRAYRSSLTGRSDEIYVNGKIGAGAKFDQQTFSIDDQNNLSQLALKDGGAITVSYWVKQEGIGGGGHNYISLLAPDNNPGGDSTQNFWTIHGGGDSPSFKMKRADGGGSVSFSSAGHKDTMDAEFTHVLYTFRQGQPDSARIYVNGVNQTNLATSGDLTQSPKQSFTEGAYFAVGGTTIDADSNGWSRTILDDYRIYDRYFTQSMVSSLYNYTKPSIDSNPYKSELANWKFNNDTYDSAHGYNGITQGLENYTTGKLQKGLDFDGSTYMEVKDEPTFDFERTDAFSFSFWAKNSTSTAPERILTKDGGGNSQGYSIRVSGAQVGDIRLVLINETIGGVDVWTNNPILNDTNWHHIAITYSGSSTAGGVRIYADGVNQTTTTNYNIMTSGSILNDNKLRIGVNFPASNFFTGELDDFRGFKTNLTASQVAFLYNSGAGTESPLNVTNATLQFVDTNVAQGNPQRYRVYPVNGAGQAGESAIFIGQALGASSVSLFLNGSQGNMTIEPGQAVNATGTSNVTQGQIRLWRDGVLAQTSPTPLENITSYPGVHGTSINITVEYPQSANFSQSSETRFIVIRERNVCVQTGVCFNTIQQAINNATNGQEVRIIVAKDYNESIVVNRTGITLTSNTTSHPVVFNNVSSGEPVINITSDNITLTNLTIKYNHTSTIASITATSRLNITIANNTVLAFGTGTDYGILLNRTNSSVIENNTIYTNTSSNNYGIFLRWSNATRIRYNSINSSGSFSNNYGVYVLNSAQNNLTFNTIGTNGTNDNYGIVLSSGLDNSLINNTVSTNGKAPGSTSSYGIFLQLTSNNNVLENNTIYTNGDQDANIGFYLDSSSLNNLSSNIIGTNGTNDNYGIYVQSASNNTITKNIVLTKGTFNNYGIQFLVGASGNVIQDNLISTNGTGATNYGIYLLTSSNSNTFINNTISTNGTDSNYGVYLDASSNTIITHNTISTSGTSYSNDGLSLTSNSNNNTLAQNTITTGGTSDSVGIFLSTSSSNTFRSNNVTTNLDGYGVYIQSSNNNTFYDGRINATQAYDVLLNGEASGNDNYFVNVSFNKSDVKALPSSTRTKLFVQYRLDITTRDQSSNALNNALVWGNDSSVPNSENPSSNFSATTNSSGQIPTQILTEFLANGTFNSSSGYLYFTNYTINASLAGYSSASLEVNLTESKSITLTLYSAVPSNNVCNLNTGICNDTIQKAINSANNYDRLVIVNATEYNESVVMNRTGITLTANTTVKPTVFNNVSSSRPTINITADNVTVRNLMIVYNGTGVIFGAVDARSRSNITIYNNLIYNTGSGDLGFGIYLISSNYSRIENNTINTRFGIGNYGILLDSYLNNNVNNNNILTFNSINTSGVSDSYGIRTVFGSNNTIASNSINTFGTSSGNYGIYLEQVGSNNNVSSNNISTYGGGADNEGIAVGTSSNNSITSNTISTNGASGDNYGIGVYDSSSNNIASNTINTNGTSSGNYGIYLSSSLSNNVSQNTVTTNGTAQNYGINVESSNSTILTGNIISTNGTGSDNNGMALRSGSYFNVISSNSMSIRGSPYSQGVSLESGSNANTFRSNNITTDAFRIYGVYISSSNNTFFDDRINATQAEDVLLENGGDNFFVNVSFNKSEINATLAGVAMKLFVQYRLDITARDQSSNALNGALVFGNDTDAQPNSANPTSNFSVTTNSTGQIPTQTLTEFLANGTFNSSSGYLYFNNYTITASKSGYVTKAIQVNLTQSINLSISLDAETPATTTTTSGGGGSGGGGGTAATTTTTIKENISAIATTTTSPRKTVQNETLRKEVDETIQKVREAIERAESAGVKTEKAKEILERALNAFDSSSYVAAKELAEQAYNEVIAKAEERAKEPSKIPYFYIAGMATGVLAIMGLLYWKRELIIEKIRPIKPAVEEAISKLKAVEMTKHEVVVKPIKLIQVKIDTILSKPEDYENKDVEVLGCKITPVKEIENGWWHTISDGSGEVFGFSSKRIEGNGTVEGTVRIVNGKVFIEF